MTIPPTPDTFADYLSSDRAAFFHSLTGDEREAWNAESKAWLASLSDEHKLVQRYDGPWIPQASERERCEQPYRKAVMDADADARDLARDELADVVARVTAAWKEGRADLKRTTSQRAAVALETERLRAAQAARTAKAL